MESAREGEQETAEENVSADLDFWVVVRLRWCSRVFHPRRTCGVPLEPHLTDADSGNPPMPRRESEDEDPHHPEAGHIGQARRRKRRRRRKLFT